MRSAGCLRCAFCRLCGSEFAEHSVSDGTQDVTRDVWALKACNNSEPNTGVSGLIKLLRRMIFGRQKRIRLCEITGATDPGADWDGHAVGIQYLRGTFMLNAHFMTHFPKCSPIWLFVGGVHKVIRLSLLALSLAASPAWAVNKCTGPDGKVTFQDAPCVGRGEAVVVKPASGMAVRAAVAAPASTPAASSAPMSAPVPVPATAAPAAPTKSAIDLQADQCLAWYKPLLRDPANAYYTEPKFEDKRVLRMTIHATNGYGGYVTRTAACEFENGKFSADWTRIQARRLNWNVN